MPFLNEFLFIHIAYLHSLFDLLFFKTMIINKLYIGTQLDFGFFAIFIFFCKNSDILEINQTEDELL